jgi:hypothetical protein
VVAALDNSPTYQAAVAQILAAHLLVEPQEVSVSEIHVVDLEGLI